MICQVCNGTRVKRTPRKGYVLQERCAACDGTGRGPSNALQLGTAMHRAAEAYFRSGAAPATFTGMHVTYGDLGRGVTHSLVVRRAAALLHGRRVIAETLAAPADALPEGPRPSDRRTP